MYEQINRLESEARRYTYGGAASAVINGKRVVCCVKGRTHHATGTVSYSASWSVDGKAVSRAKLAVALSYTVR